MEVILTNLKKWIELFGPITAFAGIVWKFFLKKKYDEYKVAHTNLMKIAEYIPKIDNIHAELKPNGGSSIRDAINRIERNLTLQDQKVSALVKSLPMGTWTFDAEGKCIDVNIQLCRMIDRVESELLGDNWINHIVEREMVRDEWERAVEGKMDFNMSYTFILPDKSTKLVQCVAFQLRNEKGLLIGFLGTLNEVS